MISETEIREIISLYEKHGWILSRVLLSEALKVSLLDGLTAGLFDDIPVTDAKLDALWFKRPRNDDHTAREIRLLSKRQFALCESYPDSSAKKDIEAGMRKMENRLLKMAS